jgi:hypothetical protein
VQTLQATGNNVKQALNNKLQTSSTVQESADRIKKEAQNDPQKAAATLTSEINRLGPKAAAELVSQLVKDDKKEGFGFSNVLKFASNNLANKDGMDHMQKVGNDISRSNLANAVGDAYKNMSADEKKDFVKSLTVQTENDGFFGRHLDPNRSPNFIAELVAASSNNDLKKDVVASLVKRGSEIESGWLGNNGGVDIKNLYESAAIIAGSGDKSSQVEMFNSITQSFSKLAGDKKQLNTIFGDKDFKDKMSQIFLNNSKEILSSATAENGRFKDAASLDGLVKFFEMSLFSKDGGKLRDAVKGEVIKSISEFANGNGGLGRTNTADSYVAGSLLGALQSAAINQKDSIKDSQKEREETAKFFTGLAFAFVPGADKVLGEGAGKILEVAYDKAKDFAKDNAESGLSGFINKMADGNALKDIKSLFTELRDLKFKISSALPENLAGSFGDGYTETGVDQLFLRALER